MPRIEPDSALAQQHVDDAEDPYGLGSYDAVLLGDTGGLTQFGAVLETLHPGSRSSRQHWHENEDEFIYMISGEVVLLEDDRETVLVAGDAATFKAGVPVAHCLQNRSADPASYLVVGTRAGRDVCHYRDDGSRVERDGPRRKVVNAQGEVIREFER
ncbi:cupin domain-containing protein [Hoeflea ulvae]|uniref:Cupin domain-containing protein n=1 Tax=Hoeflea ulvae TaxID=2983764 RepID=A0ABT3Y9N6_9HYPH|nr:cupin domain-containing protein [Hoeflea ulvae]MCY0092581.1 cupin domain-containing protein [Hoeflea ulvae]